ncbi:NDR1/HIN1-like protein 3 [Carica papaya]|uniref:NDR1/HIN1-like protein 3 n=1 Tax=Carica papaya TaxID=3649 RepID=UPI000B8C997E|nr:NDR1/HIN1-like protein 3 [Carica papaya]
MPNSDESSSSGESNRSVPSCRLLIYLFVAIFATSAIILTLIIILIPHRIKLHVTSLTLSSFSASESQLIGGTWNVVFSITNPDKKTRVAFDALQVSVFYRDCLVGGGNIQPFCEGKKEMRSVNATVVVAAPENLLQWLLYYLS